MENFELDAGTAMMIGTAVVVLTIVTIFLAGFFRAQKKERYEKLLVDKTEGAQKRAMSVILDAESRAMKDTGRDQKRPFDIVNWWAIKRDLKRAGLPRFPPLVFLFALALSTAVSLLVLNMPIYPMWAQIVAVYPAMYFLTRVSILGMRMESVKMKMMFGWEAARATSVGEAARSSELPTAA